MSVTRREIFDRLALGAQILPAWALAPRSLVGDLLFDPVGELVQPKSVPPNPFRRDGKVLVAMVHGQDVSSMLTAGLDLIGGVDRLNLHGTRVLIKPNVVNDRPPPATTSPQLVTAMVELVRQAGAAEVLVADSSGMIRFPTADNLVATGIQAAAEGAGARVLSLDDGPWVRVEPAAAESLSRFYVAKAVYQADVFINLPVVKTHRFAAYSCSLKNLVGIVHPRYRPSFTFLAGNWHERIAELNLAVHPHLTVADATTVMIEGGPTSGTPAKAELLLLSGDRVALDAVAVALIRSYGAWPKVTGTDVWRQRQIKKAAELGLGVGGPDQIELVARSVSGAMAEVNKLADRLREDLSRSTAS